MAVNLASAEVAADAPATVITYKPHGDSKPKRDGSSTYLVVESSAAGHPLYLQVTRTRAGKGKDGKPKGDAVKRIPLAPIAAAIRLGVIA